MAADIEEPQMSDEDHQALRNIYAVIDAVTPLGGRPGSPRMSDDYHRLGDEEASIILEGLHRDGYVKTTRLKLPLGAKYEVPHLFERTKSGERLRESVISQYNEETDRRIAKEERERK